MVAFSRQFQISESSAGTGLQHVQHPPRQPNGTAYYVYKFESHKRKQMRKSVCPTRATHAHAHTHVLCHLHTHTRTHARTHASTIHQVFTLRPNAYTHACRPRQAPPSCSPPPLQHRPRHSSSTLHPTSSSPEQLQRDLCLRAVKSVCPVRLRAHRYCQAYPLPAYSRWRHCSKHGA
jgi:hypothetical protein